MPRSRKAAEVVGSRKAGGGRSWWKAEEEKQHLLSAEECIISREHSPISRIMALMNYIRFFPLLFWPLSLFFSCSG